VLIFLAFAAGCLSSTSFPSFVRWTPLRSTPTNAPKQNELVDFFRFDCNCFHFDSTPNLLSLMLVYLSLQVARPDASQYAQSGKRESLIDPQLRTEPESQQNNRAPPASYLGTLSSALLAFLELSALLNAIQLSIQCVFISFGFL
jgi:hypothetical protein